MGCDMEECLTQLPTVSVIIPIYNAEKYIEKCIRTINKFYRKLIEKGNYLWIFFYEKVRCLFK